MKLTLLVQIAPPAMVYMSNNGAGGGGLGEGLSDVIVSQPFARLQVAGV